MIKDKFRTALPQNWITLTGRPNFMKIFGSAVKVEAEELVLSKMGRYSKKEALIYPLYMVNYLSPCKAILR